MDAGILITWKSLGAFTSITVVLLTFLFYVLGKAFVPRYEVYSEFKDRDDKLKETLSAKQNVDICNAIQDTTHVSIDNMEKDIGEMKLSMTKTAEQTQKIALSVASIESSLKSG